MEEARARGSVRRTTSRTMSRNRSTTSSWRMEDVFTAGSGASFNRRSSRRSEEDEEALRWAALEKLPTYDRLRTTIMKQYMTEDDERAGYNKASNVLHKEIDVRKLDPNDKQQFIDRIFKVAEEDIEKFLRKFRNRIDK